MYQGLVSNGIAGLGITNSSSLSSNRPNSFHSTPIHSSTPTNSSSSSSSLDPSSSLPNSARYNSSSQPPYTINNFSQRRSNSVGLGNSQDLELIASSSDNNSSNLINNTISSDSYLSKPASASTLITSNSTTINNLSSNSSNNILNPPNTSSSINLLDSDYWKYPSNFTSSLTPNDLVIIHVCDENQQITKDFCCKKNILINNMKYFQKFLLESINSSSSISNEDVDISVHCDVEIFEWLMTYIHNPNSPPKIDKSIIVSILISSEFLQMDSLIELCVAQVSTHLNEIIRLPIDLSCISEKLINKIALLVSPKVSFLIHFPFYLIYILILFSFLDVN